MLNLIVLIVAVIAVRKGWIRGFTGQVVPLLGVAFGAVAAHAFGDVIADSIFSAIPALRTDDIGLILASFLGGSSVFCAVWLTFILLNRIGRRLAPVNELLDDLPKTIIDQIFGAAFTLFEYLLILSVIFTLCAFFAAYHYDDPPESVVILLQTQEEEVEWGVGTISPHRQLPALIKAATDSDGNLAGAVGRLSPEAFGSLGILELGHILQLHDARRIS